MPWNTVSILWPAIVAALLPLDLATLIDRLPRVLARLDAIDAALDNRADDDRSRPRQVERFRSRYGSQIRTAA